MLFDFLPRPHAEITAGIAHLPGWLGIGQQAALVQDFRQIARSVARTPMAMTRPVLKSGGQMSVHTLNLGYFFDRETYRYVETYDGLRVPPLPEALSELAHAGLAAASEVSEDLRPWVSSYRPQMALVNFYSSASSMGLHVDAYEDCAAPIVSLSIGEEALFRMGGTANRNKPWDDITLCSGDLVVFGGPKRFAYHGVPRVNAGTAPAGCGLSEGRINVTIRQIND